jgi:hypothetical protein
MTNQNPMHNKNNPGDAPKTPPASKDARQDDKGGRQEKEFRGTDNRRTDSTQAEGNPRRDADAERQSGGRSGQQAGDENLEAGSEAPPEGLNEGDERAQKKGNTGIPGAAIKGADRAGKPQQGGNQGGSQA